METGRVSSVRACIMWAWQGTLAHFSTMVVSVCHCMVLHCSPPARFSTASSRAHWWTCGMKSAPRAHTCHSCAHVPSARARALTLRVCDSLAPPARSSHRCDHHGVLNRHANSVGSRATPRMNTETPTPSSFISAACRTLCLLVVSSSKI